jgi:hypothetical protein
VGNSYQFLEGAERLLDARAMFFYYATGITPAMSEAKPGTGSAYAVAFRDAAGNYFDGSRTYNITLPGPIPAKNFWAFTVYDNQRNTYASTVGGLGRVYPHVLSSPWDKKLVAHALRRVCGRIQALHRNQRAYCWHSAN